MTNSHTVDQARLSIMLNDLRLPTIKILWPQFAEQADREGWPAARFLAAIAEHELAERATAGSPGILPKRTCRPARRWTVSTSTPFQWSRKHRSWLWPRETAGWPRAPMS